MIFHFDFIITPSAISGKPSKLSLCLSQMKKGIPFIMSSKATKGTSCALQVIEIHYTMNEATDTMCKHSWQ